MLRCGELAVLGEKKGRILQSKAHVHNKHLQIELGILEQEQRRAEVQLRSKQEQLLRQFQSLRKRSAEIRKDLESRERSPRTTCDGPTPVSSASTATSSEGHPSGCVYNCNKDVLVFPAGAKTASSRKRWSVAACTLGASQHIQRLTDPSYIKRRFKIAEEDEHLAPKNEAVSRRRKSLDPTMLAAILDVDTSTVNLEAQAYARVRASPSLLQKSLELDGEEGDRGRTVPTVKQRRASVAIPGCWPSKTTGTRLPPLTSDKATGTANGADLRQQRRHSLPAITVTCDPQDTIDSQGGMASCLGPGIKSKPRKSSVTFAESNIIKEHIEEEK
ncbi:PREDICTED: uncharacterized protein LOC109468569 [Branchiostoma belcheri]|uniref:Uncharacterized protein LOC109468569 n=1 Tax=Branchiostoma belcheri TaxID=7741 RepID=A0A6P4Y0J4_BRABE|nr:PREDICTED: uncharacterized protein LOC109468569 [Branchiostoma belcheri]